MPKKVINVSNFSGGINKNTNSRDMVANEYQVMLNLDNEVPGKLKMYGSTEPDAYNEVDGTAIESVNHGNGLYHFNLDKDISSPATTSNREYLAINDPGNQQVRVIDYTSSSSSYDIVTNISYASTGNHQVVMYNIDGGLRVVPKVGTGGTPKILYHTDEDLHFGNDTALELIDNVNAYVEEDLFIAGLRGKLGALAVSNNLDPDKLYKKYQVFKPTRNSEVFMHNGYANSTVSSFSSPNYSRYSFSIEDNHDIFDAYTDYDPTPDGVRGGLHLIAYFSKLSTATGSENDSDITVYPNKASSGQDSEKRYGLWVSTIYEHIYESPAYFVGDIFQQDNMTTEVKRYLHFGLFGRAPGGNTRITGYKIYWGIIENFNEPGSGYTYDGQVNAKYLLAEVDFHKGLRYAGEETYSQFSQEGFVEDSGAQDEYYVNWVYPYDAYAVDSGAVTSEAVDNIEVQINVDTPSAFNTNDIIKIDDEVMKVTGTGATFINVERGYGGTSSVSHDNGAKIYDRVETFGGKRLSSLSTSEPYLVDGKSIIGPLSTGFNTIAVANRRAYIGNVKYYNVEGNLVTKNDRVLKSKPNQFDFFEADRFIDVEIEDGDDIIRLASINQQLLEFKTRKLFIINISRDIEYLEGTYPYKGCEKDYHVYEGEGFITWFNKNGVYFYDGRQLNDIHLNETGQSIFDDWDSNYYHDDNVIGFLPKTKEIYIARPDNTILKFDLKSQSWTEGDNFGSSTNSFTNFVLKNDDVLTYMQDNGDTTITLKNWNPTPVSFTGTDKVILKTKEFDFGNPTSNKNINTIYVNYKNGQNITVKGFGTRKDLQSVDVGDIGVDASSSQLIDTTDDFRTTKIAVNDTFKNLVSFGIALELDGASDADFELNDIQIVYREKVFR